MLATARRIPETRAVATLGAPADPRHVTGLLRDSLPAINVAGEAVVSIAGRQFRIRRQFLDDVAARRSANESARSMPHS
jgi:putative redox protein